MNRTTKIALYLLSCLLAAGLLLSVASCDAPLTPTEEAEVTQLDQSIDLATADLSALEKQAKEQAKLLVDADATNDAAAMAELEAIHGRYVDLAEAMQADLSARGKILQEAAERTAAPVTGGLAALFPQFGTLILAGGALASRLLAQRSREHLVDAAKAAAKLQLGDFIGGLLKSLGYAHSNSDPVDVLGGAEAAAAKLGDYAEAARIRALADGLASTRASAPPATLAAAI